MRWVVWASFHASCISCDFIVPCCRPWLLGSLCRNKIDATRQHPQHLLERVVGTRITVCPRPGCQLFDMPAGHSSSLLIFRKTEKRGLARPCS